VPSPTSCLRCFKALDVDSASGLCPTCQIAVETSQPDPDASAPQAWTDTATFRPDSSAPPPARGPEATPRGAGTATLAAPDPHALPEAPLGYEIRSKFEGGGMGVVYLAREHATDRLVAMKFLRGIAAGAALERFLVEVKVLAKLDHAGIVRVLGHDFYRADPFFTMEYAPGGTLADLVKARGPLPPDEAAQLIRQASEAVHAVHLEMILHRDLKPSNIVLGADGRPKVSDFGLAKRTDYDDGITAETGAIGTPSYMPPELCSKRYGKTGAWSDVYGLGATLYHLITGRPPFKEETNRETMNKVVRDLPPRPRSIRPEIPMALEAIVMKCLEKKPADRYQTAQALAADLGRYITGECKPDAPPLTWWRRLVRWVKRNRVAVAAGLAVLLGVTLGAVLLSPRDYPAEYRRDLRNGHPVTLVPAKGLPAWHRWAFGSTRLEPAPDAGGACSFETIRNSLLELMDDPGVDSYELAGELKLLRLRLSHGKTTEPAPTNYAGLYFAAATPDGVSHSFVAASYNDYLEPQTRQLGMTKAIAQLRTVCLFPTLEGKGASSPTQGLGQPIRFTPAETLPGEWRKFRVSVSPAGVRAYFAARPEDTPDGEMELLADLKAEDLRKALQTHRQWFNAVQPGLGDQLPDWRPRMPLGVWCQGGAVAVKNLTVSPRSPSP